MFVSLCSCSRRWHLPAIESQRHHFSPTSRQLRGSLELWPCSGYRVWHTGDQLILLALWSRTCQPSWLVMQSWPLSRASLMTGRLKSPEDARSYPSYFSNCRVKGPYCCPPTNLSHPRPQPASWGEFCSHGSIRSCFPGTGRFSMRMISLHSTGTWTQTISDRRSCEHGTREVRVYSS